MMTNKPAVPPGTPEESLDPADWSAYRQQAHAMLDAMLDHLASAGQGPAWRPIPDAVREKFSTPLPREGAGLEAACRDFAEDVLPYPLGDTHPRFFGFVNGTGSATGMLAAMLAAGMNSNTGGAMHAANLVEAQVIAWSKAMFGLPDQAGGVLTSGGSMANLIGLAAARHVQSRAHGVNIRQQGVRALPGLPRFYVSSETHSSIQRAIEALGLGTESMVVLPADRDFRFDVSALQAAIAADRAAGHLPFCIIGTAGTTNTGSLDPLDALAEVCAQEKLWLHVDAAIAGVAMLAPSVRPLLNGIARADSIAFDLHKWLYVNYAVGCVLVRSGADQREAFSLTPPYLRRAQRGMAAGEVWFSDLSLELTREFRALRVWMMLKEHGADKFGRLMEQNNALAARLAAHVRAAPEMALLAPHPLHIVNFRCLDARLDPAQTDLLNRAVVIDVQERGIAVPTSTTVRGVSAIRVCVNNHRTRAEDIDVFFAAVRSSAHMLADEIAAGRAPAL